MRSLRLSPVLVTLAGLALVPAALGACSSGGGSPGGGTQRVTGQSDYASAPLPGSGGASHSAGAPGTANGGGGSSTGSSSSGSSGGAAPPQATVNRTVQETDLYRARRATASTT